MRLQFLCTLVVLLMCIVNAQTPSPQANAKQPPDPRSLVLVGDRFKPLKYDEMTPEQKIMIDHLFAGERGGARGPFNVLLRSPEVGDFAQQFGGAMIWSPGSSPCTSAVATASPDEKANASLPPSRAAKHSSSDRRAGFPSRA